MTRSLTDISVNSLPNEETAHTKENIEFGTIKNEAIIFNEIIYANLKKISLDNN